MSDLPAEKLAGCFLEWQRIEDEKAKLSEQSKDLFKAMKAEGYDTKAVRACFREKRVELEATADDVAKAEEAHAILDLYRAALTNGLKARARPAPAHEKTLKNSAPSELTDTQEQPETATEYPAQVTRHTEGERSTVGEAVASPAPRNSPSPANTPRLAADDEAAQANPTSSASHSNPQPAASLGADTAGDVPPPSSPATLSETEIPAFLRKEEKKGCLKLKDGHCKISFETSALCSECNRAKAEKARAA